MASSLATTAPAAGLPSRYLPLAGDTNALTKIAFALTIFQVFNMEGRISEMLVAVIGTGLYLIPIVSGVLILLGLVTGRFSRVFTSKSGMYWFLFLFWITVTLPFSGWRSGSITAWIEVLKQVPMLLIVGAFCSQSVSSLRKTVWAFVWSGLLVILWTFNVKVEDASERIQAGTEGTFANANALAMTMVFLMPFFAFVAGSPRYRLATRIAFGSVIPYAAFLALRTGSRGGMLSLALISIITFFQSRAMHKVGLIVAVAIGLVVLVPAIPEKTRTRLSSVFSDDTDTTDGVDSSRARKALFWESVEATKNHPYLGVGFGVYSDVLAGEAAANGRKALWQVTHNTYTEVSAETGIPGLILWLCAVGFALKHLRTAKAFCRGKPEYEELGRIASAAFLSLALFLFNGLFTSMATSHTLFVFCGFAIAVYSFTSRLKEQQLVAAGLNPVVAGTQRPQSDRTFPMENFQTKGFYRSGTLPAPVASAPPPPPPPPPQQQQDPNQDAPWRRNPRRHPPPPGTSSR